jgi:hypothetical protein
LGCSGKKEKRGEGREKEGEQIASLFSLPSSLSAFGDGGTPVSHTDTFLTFEFRS